MFDEIKTWVTGYAKWRKTRSTYHNAYFEDTIGDITFTGYIDQIRELPKVVSDLHVQNR